MAHIRIDSNKQNKKRRKRRGATNLSARRRRELMRSIGEKYGWICQICGGKVDKSRMGNQNDPLAPSLDHKIPLWKGGSSTKDNLQISHRDCNSVEYKDMQQEIMNRVEEEKIRRR